MRAVILALLTILLEFGCCHSENVKAYNDVQVILREFSLKSDNGSGCQCKGYTCGCCLHATVEKIGLNDTVCANISYLPDEYGISLKLILDGNVLIEKKISARNPPPVCIGVPYLKKEASICIRFANLTIQNKTFSGCVDLEARLVHIIVEKLLLGCFSIPLHGNKSTIIAKTTPEGISRRNPMEKGRERFMSALMSKTFQNGRLISVVGLK